MQNSFVYEDFVSHIGTIEEQITELEKTVAQQWKTTVFEAPMNERF